MAAGPDPAREVRRLLCTLLVLGGLSVPAGSGAMAGARGLAGVDEPALHLRFVPGTTTDLAWDEVPGAESYGLYRGRIKPGTDFWALYHCHATDIRGNLARDEQVPGPGTALYYVVGWLERDPDTGDLDWHGGADDTSRRHSFLVCGERFYVDTTRPSGGDGLSWDTAYSSAREAIEDGARGEIWIRSGQRNAGDLILSGEDGVFLRGGFTGTEQEIWERLPTTAPSWIDGEIKQDHGRFAQTLWMERVQVDGEILLLMGDVEHPVRIVGSDCRLFSVRGDSWSWGKLFFWFERTTFTGSINATGEGTNLNLVVHDCTFDGSAIRVEFSSDLDSMRAVVDVRRNTFRGSRSGIQLDDNNCLGMSDQRYSGSIASNFFIGCDTAISLSCCADIAGDSHCPLECSVLVDIVENTIVDGADGIVCDAEASGSEWCYAKATCAPRIWNNVIAHNSGCAFREGKETHDEEGDTWTDPKEFITNDLYDNGCMYLDEGTDELNSIGEVNALEGAYDNLSVPPRFVDAAGGDYHLAADSPLIDRGSVGGPFAGWIDFDGDPRVMDGDHDGFAWPDVGADEVP